MAYNDGRLVGTGGVTLYLPTDGSPHFRLVYHDETGRRRQRKAGRDAAAALAKAEKLDAELTVREGDYSTRTLGELVQEYVSTGHNRKRDRNGNLKDEDWQHTQLENVRRNLRRAVRGLEDFPARDLDRETIDQMRAACGTANMVRETTSVVRNFLRFGAEAQAITWEQAELLPANARRIRPTFPQPEARPRRHQQVRVQGHARTYVREEDCPNRDNLHAFADAFQVELDKSRLRYGQLAVHTAVGTGLRDGEQFQLTAHDLAQTEEGEWYAKVDYQWCTTTLTGFPVRRALPKHGKRRVVPIMAITRDEYPLLDELLKRRDAALAEQAASANPQALLFPAPEGGIWWSASLNSRVIAAQKAAGWHYVEVLEERHLRNGKRSPVKVTQMDHTWHSLRHRFARDMVDWKKLSVASLLAVGGWESFTVVEQRYYRNGQEHLRTAFSEMR